MAAWLTLPYLSLVRAHPPLALPDFARLVSGYAILRWIASLAAVVCLLMTSMCWATMGTRWRVKRREVWWFKLLYSGFKLMFLLLTGTVIRTGNFAAFRGVLTRRVLFHPYFDLSYSSTLLSLNIPAVYVPCERGVRYAGRSKMNVSALLRHGLRMLMPFIDRIAARALVLFTIILSTGIAASIVVLAVRLFTDRGIPGWASYMLLLILTISVTALGNFLVLFVLFAQSDGLSLRGLHEYTRGFPQAMCLFWHRLRWHAVATMLPRGGPFDLVDVGAGAGFAGEYLQRDFPAARYFFVEPLRSLEERLEQRFGVERNLGGTAAFRGVRAVLLLDVLEHQEHDRAFLRELVDKMDPGVVAKVCPRLQLRGPTIKMHEQGGPRFWTKATPHALHAH